MLKYGKEATDVEDWIFQTIDLVKMAKLTCLATEKSTEAFIKYWSPFMDYVTKVRGKA